MFNIVNDKQTTDELNWDEYFLITVEPFRQRFNSRIVQYTIKFM